MGQKSKRILILTTAFRPFIGGSELAIENLTRRLPDVFFDVVTPRYRSGLPADEAQGNIRIHRVGLGFSSDKYLFPFFGFWKANSLLRQGGHDLIHAYQASQAAGAGWLLKIFRPRLRMMVSLQEGKNLERQSFLIRFLRELILKKADLITGISSHLVNYGRKINPRAQTALIPNGVDTSRFKITRDEARINLGFNDSDQIVMTVSRLVQKNGLFDLVRAMCQVKSKLPAAKLVIVGRGHLETEIRSQVNNLGLEHSVLMLGEIEHVRVPEYLAAADLFVRPSHSEGLGTAFLEAMAAGVPVIATPVGGIVDFLVDGQTGIFCRVNQPDDLAEKILAVLADKNLRENLVSNARTLISDKYDWNRIASQFERIYSYGV